MKTPEKGFYSHYKRDPNVWNDHAYEVLGVALHTEDKSQTVIYRPLYENAFLKGFDYCSRPLEMFMENVEKDGDTFPRFSRIIDPKIIEKLEKIRVAMYRK